MASLILIFLYCLNFILIIQPFNYLFVAAIFAFVSKVLIHFQNDYLQNIMVALVMYLQLSFLVILILYPLNRYSITSSHLPIHLSNWDW